MDWALQYRVKTSGAWALKWYYMPYSECDNKEDVLMMLASRYSTKLELIKEPFPNRYQINGSQYEFRIICRDGKNWFEPLDWKVGLDEILT